MVAGGAPTDETCHYHRDVAASIREEDLIRLEDKNIKRFVKYPPCNKTCQSVIRCFEEFHYCSFYGNLAS